jgi:4-amino-4-deoxy-L-arabinose transferase-like glycosyltransferase
MNMKKYVCLALLFGGLLFSAVLIFLNLGNGSIDLWDESITAGRSLYVYNTHSLINLEVNGEITPRKPPLIYILNAVSFSIFGINEFGLRFPSALFGFFCFCMLAIGVYRISGINWACPAPWLLAGSSILINASREALTDTVFVCGFLCASLAVLFELMEEDHNGKKWRWLYAFGVFTVLFGKGPVGLFLILYTLLFLVFIDRRLALKYLIPSIAACMPLAIWMLVQSHVFPDFLRVFIKEEYLERMNYKSDFLSEHISHPLWYFNRLWPLFKFAGYASLILPVISLFIMKSPEYAKDRKRILFLFGIAVTYLLFISVVAHKQNRYILPLFPIFVLLFLLSAQFLFSLIKHKTLRHGIVVAVAVFIIAGLHTTFSQYEFIPDYQPDQKAVSLKVSQYAEGMLPVYTDIKRLATTMHFYLKRPVFVVSDFRDISAGNYVYVSKKPVYNSTEYKGYYISVVRK